MYAIQYSMYSGDENRSLETSEAFNAEPMMKTQVQGLWKKLKRKHEKGDPQFHGVIQIRTVTEVTPVDFDWEIK